MTLSIKETSITDRIDYILIYLLISISGNYAFGETALIFTFLASFLTFVYRKKLLDHIFLFFIFILTIILHLQAIKFDFYPWVTLLGLYIRVFTGYFIIKSIGETFIKKFVNVMLVLSVISLCFFLLSNIIPGFISLMKPFAFVYYEEIDSSTNYLSMTYYTGIHTFRYMPYSPFDFTRNSGPFWEAGALAGYVLVAFILNTMVSGELINRKNIIFIVTIFSTVSTTSLVALMAVVLFYLMLSPKYKIFKAITLPIVGALSIFLFIYLDFLGAKIEKRIELAQNPGIIYTTKSSRFGDAVRDIYALQGHEIIGRGINQETRLSNIDKQSGYTIRTNGLTDHLVKFGVVFFIITFILMYFSFYIVNNYYHGLKNIFALYTVFIILLLLQSETYFRFPLFWGLLFLYSAYIKIEKEDDALHCHTRIQ